MEKKHQKKLVIQKMKFTVRPLLMVLIVEQKLKIQIQRIVFTVIQH